MEIIFDDAAGVKSSGVHADVESCRGRLGELSLRHVNSAASSSSSSTIITATAAAATTTTTTAAAAAAATTTTTTTTASSSSFSFCPQDTHPLLRELFFSFCSFSSFLLPLLSSYSSSSSSYSSSSSSFSVYRIVGLEVKACARRAADPGFDSRFLRGEFSGSNHASDLKLGTPPCQAPGVIGSALGLVGSVSVCCDWTR